MAEDDTEQSPFSRPGFIIGATFFALILIAGVIIAFITATMRTGPNNDPVRNPTSSSTTSETPLPEPRSDAGNVSVCGLGGGELSGTVTAAPPAEWAHVRSYGRAAVPSRSSTMMRRAAA